MENIELTDIKLDYVGLQEARQMSGLRLVRSSLRRAWPHEYPIKIDGQRPGQCQRVMLGVGIKNEQACSVSGCQCAKTVPKPPELCRYRRPRRENCFIIQAGLDQEFDLVRINPGESGIAHIRPVQHCRTACSQATNVLCRRS